MLSEKGPAGIHTDAQAEGSVQQESPSTSRNRSPACSHAVLTFQNVQLKGHWSLATFKSDLKAANEKKVDIAVKELENTFENIMWNVT